MVPHWHREIETVTGITGEDMVSKFDVFQRTMRDRGWIETDEIIKSGISVGNALELGHGPGYVGLEWLRKTDGTHLTGLDISAVMTAMARLNAEQYGLSGRTEYVTGDGISFPFEDNTFDAVFSTGSLHEWEHPEIIFNEIHRVLKTGGRWFIGDLQRFIPPCVKALIYMKTEQPEIKKGFLTSVNAAYTSRELKNLLSSSRLAPGKVKCGLIGLSARGIKS
ncbi:class I SAM-dependent methyltransferase [Myxococcota bacterium]|nr:class I SAM-dependent methyltransferase [Myxococcota bacterium]MBU1379476.1 class I SAM-dependent methyltransferase [Myxococcota bacterium]MBU1496179.1 class I SAM-dependent methyltransferase [Myxococcota bacterium]